MHPLRRSVRLLARLVPLAMLALYAPATVASAAPVSAPGCNLDPATGQIKHVIEIQFDNVHFRRDNPNVPSDIEQIPSLYNFLVGNGTVLNNHHTPLIAHTGTDILTTLTGLYPEDHGQAVSNTFDFFTPDGIPHTALSFAYWTDKTQAFDGAVNGTYNLTTPNGLNAPAPWVPFTRAGCNVGGIGTANIELERTNNIATVYGAGSPEATEAADKSAQGVTNTTADFIGIAVHCAKGQALCAAANHGQPDLLPNEPGGYSGYDGLFGHKYVAPQISSTLPMTDLNGAPMTDFGDNNTQAFGFPGSNGMSAAVSLSYIAAMQEHGVAVTYAYISAPHEQNDTGLGPGDSIYESNLRAYDKAFANFFARLAKDGIDKSNTLFVVGADENDHFVGTGPLNPGCDGVHSACQYDPNKLGNVEVALDTLLTNQGITTPFDIHSDSAPVFCLNGQPGQNDPATRTMERTVGALQITNPLTGNKEPMTNFLADKAELRLMHMITGDPSRDPTFVQFAKPDYVGVIGGLDCTNDPTITVMQCPGVEVWNHGDLAPDINHTWFGFAGPGIRNRGIDNTTWTDHTDIRPTILTDLGLRDDYTHDGRPVSEILQGQGAQGDPERLGQVFKAINAPVGQLSMTTVNAATQAMESGSATNDSRYTRFDGGLASIVSERNELVREMRPLLDGAPGDQSHVQQLIERGEALLETAQNL